MEYKKLSAPSLKELFIESIQTAILSGELKIGQQLPPERNLADQMGVSRAVVNTGINELVRMGFLEVRPRIGTFVCDYRQRGTLETLKAIMNYNRGQLRNEEIASILEIRDALDKLAANLIIDYAKDEEISSLKDKAQQILLATNVEETADAAYNFQLELAFLSQNHLLPLLFRSFYNSTKLLWERFASLYGQEYLYSSALTLWEHLVTRDKEGAFQWISKSTQDVLFGEKQIYFH